MQLINVSDRCDKFLNASCVTIGNFDGVHHGHAEIFSHLKLKSRSLGLPSAVVTFEPHPLAVISPESAPPMITTFEQKAALIEKAGVDYLVVIPFSKDFSQVSANDFVIDFLCGSLGMRHMIIGHDYAFGRNREGDFATLVKLGATCGFTLEDLPPIGAEDVIFSSSLVRFAVSNGDVEAASRTLGRYYQICGRVVHGREIGHSIGFPTANIATPNELIPSDGVYAVIAAFDGIEVKGACSIGRNPTFGENERTIEVFLLDYSGELYGSDIVVFFVQRVRPVLKYPDAGALKKAISQDVANTRLILENTNRCYLI